jgi:hypothetical protein
MQLAQSACAQFHERLIDRDAREPGLEAEVSTKYVHVQESPRKGILRNLLGIFAVPGNLLREPENPRAESCDDLFEHFRSVRERGVGFLRIRGYSGVSPLMRSLGS